jgi:hypothetical protein
MSKNDNDRHYITAAKLMQLYKVDPRECIIYRENVGLDVSKLIPLRPRYNGNYELKKES